ncbi:MAG: DNA polymerase Y family protein [Rhodospirillaceae bacterium]|nr:DNA polymerase Y family protein [Rhodospirillaceae bacterium]
MPNSRRFLALWLPYFAVESAPEGVGGDQNGSPTVLVADRSGRREVRGIGPEARGLGIVVGRSLSDARALEPGVVALEEDPAAARAALERLADWCGRYTPLVAIDPAAGETGDGGLLLDVTGCAHLFDVRGDDLGEAAMLSDLLARLRRFGHVGRAAIADTPGAAWAASRFATRGESKIVAPGETAAALADMPLAALRLPAAAIEGLERVGLRRISDLYGVARAPVATRFGTVVSRQLDQALGKTSEPISPRGPVFPHRVRLGLPDAITQRGDIEHGLHRLIARLVERLEREHAGVRRLRFTVYRVDGETRSLVVGTSRARRDVRVLMRLFAEHLDYLDPGFGIDALALEALEIETAAWRQNALAGEGKVETEAAIADLVDKLTNRLGPGAVTQPMPRESHLPERAELRSPWLAPRSAPRPAPRPEGGPSAWRSAPGPVAPRPIRLLPRAEAVEATALLPDHPPARFRWRGVDYRVARAAGPERIAPEWWRDKTDRLTRDYFRVEDEVGRRFWLYRQGLSERGEAPAWYLHGLFA